MACVPVSLAIWASVRGGGGETASLEAGVELPELPERLAAVEPPELAELRDESPEREEPEELEREGRSRAGAEAVERPVGRLAAWP